MKRRIFKIARTIVPIVVLVLGALFIRPDLSKEQLTQYWQPPSAFVTLPSGATAHYRDQGNPSGPVIVLLHGGLASLHTWEPWAKLLGKDYRIVTVDLPGHGFTGRIPADVYTRPNMVRFLDEFFRKIEIDRFVLGGHSMGGGVATLYTLEHPKQIEALVLISSDGIPPKGGYDRERSIIGKDGLLPGETSGDVSLSVFDRLTNFLSSPRLIEETLKTMVADDSLVTQKMVDRYTNIQRYKGNRHAITLLRRQYYSGVGPRDLEPRLGEITVPVLLQFGSEDETVPVAIAEKFRERLPDNTFLVYDNVGHIVMEEIPEKSANDVGDFLKKHGIDAP